MARPMPRLPPVTSATRLASEPTAACGRDGIVLSAARIAQALHGSKCRLYFVFKERGNPTPHLIEFSRSDIARTRQGDRNDLFDPARARRHDHHAVAEQDGFFNIMRNEQHSSPLGAPDA